MLFHCLLPSQIFVAVLFTGNSDKLPPSVSADSLRSGIQTYHLVGSMQNTVGDGSSKSANRISQSIEVWCDGKSLRIDYAPNAKGANQATPSMRTIECFDCNNDGKTIYVSQGTTASTPVQYRNPSTHPSSYKFDWTKLGLLNADMGQYWKAKWDQNINMFINPPPAVFNDPIHNTSDNLTTIILALRNGNGINKCVLDMKANYNPIELEYRSGSQADDFSQFITTTKVEYSTQKRDGKSFYFPKSIHHKRISGGEVLIEEIISFTKIEINVDIPKSVFSLAGFGLADGTPVSAPGVTDVKRMPTLQGGIVDHEKRVSVTDFSSVNPIPDVPPPSLWSRSWPYLVGASVLALVGFFLLRRMRKQPA